MSEGGQFLLSLDILGAVAFGAIFSVILGHLAGRYFDRAP